MKQVSFFGVMANYDTTEGRGPMFFTGVAFTNHHDALKFVTCELYAKKWGVQGTKGSEYDVKEMTVTIYDDIHDAGMNFKKVVDEEKRLSALAKLTPEDRRVLGL